MSSKKMQSVEFIDFQGFPRLLTVFNDFPVLENTRLKFKYYPGFPVPVQTMIKAFATAYLGQ